MRQAQEAIVAVPVLQTRTDCQRARFVNNWPSAYRTQSYQAHEYIEPSAA
jgi:hypothetical protein